MTKQIWGTVKDSEIKKDMKFHIFRISFDYFLYGPYMQFRKMHACDAAAVQIWGKIAHLPQQQGHL